jgi:hypothetical protein
MSHIDDLPDPSGLDPILHHTNERIAQKDYLTAMSSAAGKAYFLKLTYKLSGLGYSVNSRTSSLEMQWLQNQLYSFVSCHIGSLEKIIPRQIQALLVNCRIGSLEIDNGV